MKSLENKYLESAPFTMELAEMMRRLGEYKGKTETYSRQTPQILETLKEAAIIQSTESSNRIEGITVLPDRLRALLLKQAKPENRSEAEIVGYRKVLANIHTNFADLDPTPDTILKFHKGILAGTGLLSGVWKQKDNTIEERLPDGQWITRFIPVSARDTPYYMEETCKIFRHLWNEEKISRLFLIAAFALDFLCIHPFSDGNGRVSRLLTVLLLHQAGYDVGRYISLERAIEETKESYYDVLHRVSQGWHEGRHDIRPWWEYFLSTLLIAYRELEERTGLITRGRGAKTSLIQTAIENLPSTFTISDLERACPSVGRDMIRVVLNRMRKGGRLRCLGTGRGARWRKI